MPISPDLYQALDDATNRLATESILAQAGRDDGLVPSYSLLGDLQELCAGDPLLLAPVTAARAALEKLLDTARPFDEATLGEFRRLIDWLPLALNQVKMGETVSTVAVEKAATPISMDAPSEVPTAATSGDLMLDLNLEENR
jgi:two-component system, chemotaxis family, sensor kinase CheA